MKTTLGVWTVSLAVFASVQSGGRVQDPAPAQPAAAQDRVGELTERAWEGLYTSKVHVRYHQGFAKQWGRYATAAPIADLFLILAALSGPYIFTNRGHKEKWGWGVLAVSSAFVTLSLHLIPFNEWRNQHHVLAHRWNELAVDWEKLWRGYDDLSEKEFDNRLKELLTRKAAIEGAEPPGYSDSFLAKCQEAENNFQGVRNPEKPQANTGDRKALLSVDAPTLGNSSQHHSASVSSFK